MKSGNVKGIIFDMDNTILQSNIHFAAMKRDIYQYLVHKQVLTAEFPLHDHTTSTIIEHARLTGGIDDATYNAVMAIAAEHEILGMEGAGLEPGVSELLGAIHQKFTLAVVTNNSLPAAKRALELTNVSRYFELIVGREQMTALKPSPSGFQYVLDHFTAIEAKDWLSVGDAWIDGRASADAGIPFISYRTSKEEMRKRGVHPIGQINHIAEILAYAGQ